MCQHAHSPLPLRPCRVGDLGEEISADAAPAPALRAQCQAPPPPSNLHRKNLVIEVKWSGHMVITQAFVMVVSKIKMCKVQIYFCTYATYLHITGIDRLSLYIV